MQNVASSDSFGRFFQPNSKINATMADWLDLHGLSAPHCRAIMQRGRRLPVGLSRGATSCRLSRDEAWGLAEDALAKMLPADLVRETRAKTVVVCDPLYRRPMTVPKGRTPIVLLDYRGRVRDLLTVAHEYGHALQVVASDATPSPVVREICAFLAELALLDLLRERDPELHTHVEAAWQAENDSYVSRAGAALARGLREPETAYRYDVNYPIARTLASECFGALPKGQVLRLYQNRIPLGGLLQFLKCGKNRSPSCDAACLAIGPGNRERPEIPVA